MTGLMSVAIVSMLLSAPPAAMPDTTAFAHVEVDPRIELIGVVQLLSGYMLATQHDFAYKRDVEAYFSPFRDHPAVKMFTGMSGESFNFDAVPKAMLSLGPPPALEPRGFSKYVVERAGGDETLNRFVEALRDFAVKSDFAAFYDNHAAAYEAAIEATRADAMQAVEALRDYSGMDVHGTVILGLLFHDGGFASRENPAGVYAIIGPVGADADRPDFGDADRIAPLVAHEFSHTFVNPLTAEHAAEVDALSGLYDPIADAMKRQAYGDWQTAVNEHVVRAVTTRLAYLRDGPDAGDKALAKEEKRGFLYVAALAERLEEYESSREEYPTFAAFYPRLIDVFREASESDAH